ncbi:MAG: diaminopimelate epimerase [Alphaproteobacteria bacterium]|nr:diaminopimelate epimerase [Alphaproteobacteria bacterium]
MRMIPFTKMHGIGNDCVVIDARVEPYALHEDQIRLIADRRRGVGCDQLVLIEPPRDGRAVGFLRFYNSDGSEAEACGNATRCIVARLMQENNTDEIAVETRAGFLPAHIDRRGLVAVDMGPAQTGWRDIPLSREMDTLHLDLASGPYRDPVAIGIGNPHCVFFVDDAEDADPSAYGPAVEHHPLFPERTNVEFVGIQASDRIRMRVWERGAGVTQACGSGACAAAVAAARRELTGRQVEVVLDGGSLYIDWRADNHVVMSGPVAVSFTGVLDDAVGSA